MNVIKVPPQPITGGLVFQYIGLHHSAQIGDYLEFYQPIDSKGRYLPYDELRFRVPKPLSPALAWEVVKLSRQQQYTYLLPLGDQGQLCPFVLTPTLQKAISFTDRNTTSAAVEWMTSKIGEEQHMKYLLNDLVEDEAISSSQLEGAATTTLVAKDMLKRQRKARTADEKMILGNFAMMRFAWENRGQPLSLDLITELHCVGVEGIEDENYTPGVFRQTDDVAVVGQDGEVVHQPPSAEGINARLERLCDWINTCHDNANTQEYVHPLVKAMALHFAIGFEHPFRDGNGRVARALFYWFMFKSDFAAFRYISISVLLKNAAVKYGKSYLYTETDQMDLTYFFDYQGSVVLKAIEQFTEAYKKSLHDLESFNRLLWESGLVGKMSDKQKTVFHVARSKLHANFTASNVKENLKCSYNTANDVLKGLVELNLFSKEKQGKEWVYNMLATDTIRRHWGR